MIQFAHDPDRPPPLRSDRMRIAVAPRYSRSRSQPPESYVFVYFVRIENVGADTAQLYWRHWRIHDAAGGDQEVGGRGVVGQCPVLAPGDVHEYASFCRLEGRRGHMEGHYRFRDRDGSTFRVRIPRFELRAPRAAAEEPDPS